jgi:hypothetical protein
MILAELGVAVHEKAVPETLERRVRFVDTLLHWLDDMGLLDTSGMGLTVTTKLETGPLQPFAVGVMA